MIECTCQYPNARIIQWMYYKSAVLCCDSFFSKIGLCLTLVQMCKNCFIISKMPGTVLWRCPRKKWNEDLWQLKSGMYITSNSVSGWNSSMWHLMWIKFVSLWNSQNYLHFTKFFWCDIIPFSRNCMVLLIHDSYKISRTIKMIACEDICIEKSVFTLDSLY